MTQLRKGMNQKQAEQQIWKDNEKRIQEIALKHPETNGSPIFYFEGVHGFLSNFAESKIELSGHSFQNGEAAFQSFKDLSRMSEFATIRPNQAKRLGRQVNLRADWEQIKDSVMYDVVLAKFSQNDDLKTKLLATNERLLVEGNWWKDKIWGVAEGKGDNRLGEILMRVRKELKA